MKRNTLINRLAVSAISILSCLAVATGLPCAALADGTVLTLPADDQQVINTHLGPGVVGQALPGTPITAPAIFPLTERRQLFGDLRAKHQQHADVESGEARL